MTSDLIFHAVIYVLLFTCGGGVACGFFVPRERRKTRLRCEAEAKRDISEAYIQGCYHGTASEKDRHKFGGNKANSLAERRR